jgi:sarcosine oxidase subunit alpha
VSSGRLPAPWGRRIDRTKTIAFRFEGRSYTGHPGDTIASALAGAGQWVLSRSFKYHRPRGMISAAGLEANTMVQCGPEPNVLADRHPITPGLEATAQNTFGSLERDYGRIIEKFSRFLPVGFYYRTFFTPRVAWRFWEPVIRKLAGLGAVELDARHGYFDKAYLFADVAIIGGGPAGMAAALAAAKTGAEVVLIDENAELGGALTYARFDVNGRRADETRDRLLGEIAAAGITVLTGASVQGWFSDNWLPVVQGNRLYKLRAKSIVTATGAAEQPMVFRHNDLPGILLGSAAQRLMRHYGIKPGERAVVVAANSDAYAVALDLLDAGIEIAALVDLRATPALDSITAAALHRGVRVIKGSAIREAVEGHGGRVRAVTVAPIVGEGVLGAGSETIACDLVCISVGYVPQTALLSHADARLIPDPLTAMPRLETLPPHLFAAGSVAGRWELDATLADGRRAGLMAAADAGFAAEPIPVPITPDGQGLTWSWPIFPHPKGKEFVDFDEDLQYRDIPDAAALGYDHIQLLKRFSTAGMGPTQGKITNTLIQRVLARATGASPERVGTATVRPPIGGEKIGHLAGRSFDPVRLTAMHHRHLEAGASMMPAGAWMRPAYYGDDQAAAILREVAAARSAVGIIDVSTLGGLDIRGPDAAAFLERMYTWNYANLAVGRVRYLLMLNEGGYIIDDGIAARLHERHYYVTATTGAVDQVYRAMLWFNAQWRLQVDIANVTAAYAGVNLIGPQSRAVLARLTTDIDLSPEAFPYLGIRTGQIAGIPARVMRVGFGGELGYEIHVPAGCGEALWDALIKAGEPAGLRPVGIEAQRVLRLEKGHIIIGQDTDSLTHPIEAGMGWAVGRKKTRFVGRPAMLAMEAKPQTRKLVGFNLVNPDDPMPKESHLVIDASKSGGREIIGRVTSVTHSPTLGKVIGLAFVPPELATPGSLFQIKIEQGRMIGATVVPTPFYDPENKRQEM